MPASRPVSLQVLAGPSRGLVRAQVGRAALLSGPILIGACACANAGASPSAHDVQGSPRPGVMRASAGAVRTTVGETYNGMGAAVRAPFRDFNLMREKVPIALLNARRAPYATDGLTSCGAIAEEIATLDLALGPDLDTPRVDDQRDRWQRGASMAADAALEAAKGAVDHFIPVRGVIREVSGARRAERDAKRALLAGSVRRGFLKAVGMQQNCAWPAAPVTFTPRPVAPSLQVAQVAPTPAARPPVMSLSVRAAPFSASGVEPLASNPPAAIGPQAVAVAPGRR